MPSVSTLVTSPQRPALRRCGWLCVVVLAGGMLLPATLLTSRGSAVEPPPNGEVTTTADTAPKPVDTPAPPARPGSTKIESRPLDGLENVHTINDRLWCGGSPDNDAALDQLSAAGIRTIISVDGMTPLAKKASERGLRYVHLPIGYDRVPEERIRELWFAIETSPGPVYLHCHHGKHRGPAAALAVQRLIDPELDEATAQQVMTRLGTAPKYRGLFQSVAGSSRAAIEWPTTVLKLPEIAPVPHIVELMVDIDHAWSALPREWPAGASDADGQARDALRAELAHLTELTRESSRLAVELTDPLREELTKYAEQVEAGLGEIDASREGDQPASLARDWTTLYGELQSGCTKCHARHRDNR